MLTQDQYNQLKYHYREMMKVELQSNEISWLRYGNYAEKIIYHYVTMNNLLWERNDIKDKYAADYISHKFHYLIDAKNCLNVTDPNKLNLLPTTIKYDGNVLKLRLSCIDSYYRQCKDKTDMYDWKWALAIYDYNADEIKFMTQETYENMKSLGSIHIMKDTSHITGKIEDHIFFNTNKCHTLAEFKAIMCRREKDLSDKSKVFNKPTKDVFYHVLKQYDENVQIINISTNYYKLFSPKYNLDFIGTTCIEKNNNNIHLSFKELNENNCMIIFNKNYIQAKEIQQQDNRPVVLGFNIKFSLNEKEIKFIFLDDFIALKSLKVGSPIHTRPVSGGLGYNFSKEILIPEKEFFKEIEYM